MFLRLFLLLFSLGLASTHVRAQRVAERVGEVGRPFLMNFSPDEYGGRAQNWAITQDQRGVIYVGNAVGVLEFDGVTWRTIPIPNNSTVRSLATGDDGRIYVGAVGEIGYLAPDELGEMHYRSLVQLLEASDRQFLEVYDTAVAQGGVFFRARDRIFRYANGAIKVWAPRTTFGDLQVIRDTIYATQHGVGLMKVEGDSLHIIPGVTESILNDVKFMLPFDKKRLLIGTRKYGFFLFDERTLTPFKTDVDALLRESQVYVSAAILSDGTFALSTRFGGVFILDRQGRLRQHISEIVELPDNNVRYIYPDHSGGLWLGLESGIARVETPSTTTLFGEESGLSGGVNDIERHGDKLYAATRNGVYYLQDSVFQPVTGIQMLVWDLQSLHDVLLAATSEGIFWIDGMRATLVSTSDARAFHHSEIDSTLLFVGLDGGISVLEVTTGSPDTWVEKPTKADITEEVFSIVEDSLGRLWAGTTMGALVVDFTADATWEDPRVTRFGEDNSLPPGEVFVYKIKEDVFFASENDLYKINSVTSEPAVDTSFTPLSFEEASYYGSLVEDNSNRVWITSRSGAGVAVPREDGTFEVEQTHFKRFKDLVLWSSYPEADGVVWFLGQDGIVRYDSQVDKEYSTVFPAMIRQVKAGGDSLLQIRGTAEAIQTAPQNILNYADNSLRFDYAAPSYDAMSSNQYQSYLEGFERNWSVWSGETWRNYTNLAEGTYRFRVRFRNVYGEIGEEASFGFVIQPPWYRTWWLYLLYCGLILSGIIILSQIQHRRITTRERLRAEFERAKAIESTNEELQRALKYLTETQDQLIHTEKMASLGQLTAGIAHEIKNPLNFVNNFAELASSQAEEIETILENEKEHLSTESAYELKALLDDLKFNAQKINEHGQRADGIIRSMLEHSRTGRGERRPININKLVDEYANLAYHGIRAREDGFEVTLKRDYDQAIGEVDIYPQEIGRMLINLLDNAFYTVREKQLSVNGQYAPQVSVSTKKAGGRVEVRISDNGIGVPEEILEKIFEPFFTTKPAGSGTGLGLSLSYDIVVKGHGGNLAVESEGDKGATFVVTLPLGSKKAG